MNIQAKEIRLLDEAGKQIGIFSRDEAVNMAKSEGKDLVEIAPNAQPPVCKIIDFKKFRYQEKKKDREIRKKTRPVELKQIRLRPFIGEHDFNVRINKAKEFITDGDRVKIIVQFAGRQLGHKEFGFKIIDQVTAAIADCAKRERDPKFEGKQLTAYFIPKKGEKHAESENEKGNN